MPDHSMATMNNGAWFSHDKGNSLITPLHTSPYCNYVCEVLWGLLLGHMVQEEEYRRRQFAEVDRTASGNLAEHLQAQDDLVGSSGMDVPDLAGRQGTLGSGYFDAAGNWQTYDMDTIAAISDPAAEAPPEM